MHAFVDRHDVVPTACDSSALILPSPLETISNDLGSYTLIILPEADASGPTSSSSCTGCVRRLETCTQSENRAACSPCVRRREKCSLTGSAPSQRRLVRSLAAGGSRGRKAPESSAAKTGIFMKLLAYVSLTEIYRQH